MGLLRAAVVPLIACSVSGCFGCGGGTKQRTEYPSLPSAGDIKPAQVIAGNQGGGPAPAPPPPEVCVIKGPVYVTPRPGPIDPPKKEAK